MLTLVYSREPRWIEIGGGAQLEIEPADLFHVYAAQAEAADLLSKLKDAGEAVTRVGGHIVNVPDFADDPEREQSVLEALFVIALGELLVKDWRHVASAEGTELDFDLALISTLFEDETIAARFLREARGPLHQVSAEGNVSGLSPNGTSERAGAEPTAMPAFFKAPPVPPREPVSARIMRRLRALMRGDWSGGRSRRMPGG